MSVELTCGQRTVVDAIQSRLGRAAVLPMDAGRVLVIGLVDDVETCHVAVAPDATRRPATAEELRRFGPGARGLFARTEEAPTCPTCGRLVA